MLTETQTLALDRVIKKMQSGEYKFRKNPCLCGAQDSTTLATKDRYGLSVTTVLCNACGIVRTDPYYTEETLADFYSNEYRKLYTGNTIADERFFSNQQSFGAVIYEFLSEKVFGGEIKNKKVFEIGCGAGGILETFREHGNDVYGCDYGEDYLAFGKEKGLRLVAGGSETLAQFGKADIVILNHTLEHMTKIEEELKKIRDLLSPSGVLYIALPGIFHLHDDYRGKFTTGYLQNAHVWYFTLKTLSSTLAKFGFKLIAGNETILSAFQMEAGNINTEPEDSKKVLAYLQKTQKLRLWYGLKKFSPRHFAFETLRRFGPLYRVIRSIYRRFKK